MEEFAPTDKNNRSLREVILENDYILVKINPEIGGKITEITNKFTGSQFLHKIQKKLTDNKKPSYGDEYLPPSSDGFDECFPTVAPCKYRDNGSAIHFPDHGELWTKAWDVENEKGKLTLKATGVNLDYELSKTIVLVQNSIQITYTLKNTGIKSFQYLWSSHPLLQVEAGDEIILPAAVEQLLVYFSNHKKITNGTYTDWPNLVDEFNDFSEVLDKNVGWATKLFAENIQTGKAALYRKEKKESIVFEFNTDEIPHLGLWLCYGGWPEDSENQEYVIALEPTTANTDDLSEAITKNSADEIKVGQQKTWSLSISLVQGKTAF